MRKLFALLLAMMMLALPMTALAEDDSALLGNALSYYQDALDAGRRVYTKISYGQLPEELANEPEIGVVMTALFDSLVIEEAQQGEEKYVSIGFEKENGLVASVLSLGLLVDGDDTYVQSNFLGAAPIVVGADDLTVVTGRLLGVLVEMGAIEVDDAMEILPELPAMIEMIKAQMGPMDVDLEALDFSSVVSAVLPVAMKAEQVEMTMQPRNCDAAATEHLLVVTTDDAKKIVTGLLTFIKDNPVLLQLLEAQQGAGTPVALYQELEIEIPTIEQQIDEAIAKIQEAGDTGNTVHIRFWNDENGEMVCAKMDGVNAEGAVELQNALVYNRLTLNDKVAHSVTMGSDDEVMTVEVLLGANSLRVSLSMDEYGEFAGSMLLDLTCQENAGNVKTNLFVEIASPGYEEQEVVRIDYVEDAAINGVDFVSNIEAAVSVNGMKMLTINGEAYTEDPAPSIKDGNVIRLAALTDAEFANWFAGVMNAIQSWPMTLLMSMPAELLQMMMQTGM